MFSCNQEQENHHQVLIENFCRCHSYNHEHLDFGKSILNDNLSRSIFQDDERRSENLRRNESERYDEESDESDADDFIVDDFGVPIAEKKRKRRPVFTDHALQEGQDIFGVDFDYNEFEQEFEDEYEDESADEDEYEEEERGEKKTKKVQRKKVQKKSIFDIYEPSELKRGHFTDLDNHVSYKFLLYKLKK